MKLLVAFSLFALAIALFYLPAGADGNEDGVEIEVTPKVISITVPDIVLSYGSPQTGSVDNRPSPAGFDVTNNGTAPVKLQIAGSDTVGDPSGLPGWELGNSAGPDTYVHRYAVNVTNPTYPGEFPAMDESAIDFLGSLATGVSANIKLSLDMPITTSTTETQTATVTIIAIEAP